MDWMVKLKSLHRAIFLFTDEEMEVIPPTQTNTSTQGHHTQAQSSSLRFQFRIVEHLISAWIDRVVVIHSHAPVGNPEHVIDLVGPMNWLFWVRSISDQTWICGLSFVPKDLNWISWKNLQRDLRFFLNAVSISRWLIRERWSSTAFTAEAFWMILLDAGLVGVIDYPNFGILDLIRPAQSEEHKSCTIGSQQQMRKASWVSKNV